MVVGVGGVDFMVEVGSLIGVEVVGGEEEWLFLVGVVGGSIVVYLGFLVGVGLVVIGVGVGIEVIMMGDFSVLIFFVEEGCVIVVGVGVVGFVYSCWIGFGFGIGGS